MKYAWIKQHRDSFSVIVICRVLGVSKSGFYKWLKAAPSPRARRSERIRATVREIHEQSNQIYGITKSLKSCRRTTIWKRLVATLWRQPCVKLA